MSKLQAITISVLGFILFTSVAFGANTLTIYDGNWTAKESFSIPGGAGAVHGICYDGFKNFWMSGFRSIDQVANYYVDNEGNLRNNGIVYNVASITGRSIFEVTAVACDDLYLYVAYNYDTSPTETMTVSILDYQGNLIELDCCGVSAGHAGSGDIYDITLTDLQLIAVMNNGQVSNEFRFRLYNLSQDVLVFNNNLGTETRCISFRNFQYWVAKQTDGNILDEFLRFVDDDTALGVTCQAMAGVDEFIAIVSQ